MVTVVHACDPSTQKAGSHATNKRGCRQTETHNSNSQEMEGEWRKEKKKEK